MHSALVNGYFPIPLPLNLQAAYLPFIFIVAQESAKLGGVGMFKEHDEEMIVELKRTRELTKNLPDAVQEEQEDGGLPFLLAIWVGRLGTAQLKWVTGLQE